MPSGNWNKLLLHFHTALISCLNYADPVLRFLKWAINKLLSLYCFSFGLPPSLIYFYFLNPFFTFIFSISRKCMYTWRSWLHVCVCLLLLFVYVWVCVCVCGGGGGVRARACVCVRVWARVCIFSHLFVALLQGGTSRDRRRSLNGWIHSKIHVVLLPK